MQRARDELMGDPQFVARMWAVASSSAAEKGKGKGKGGGWCSSGFAGWGGGGGGQGDWHTDSWGSGSSDWR